MPDLSAVRAIYQLSLLKHHRRERRKPEVRCRNELVGQLLQERTFRSRLSAQKALTVLEGRRSTRPQIPISISWETGTVPEIIALMSVCNVTSSFAVLTDTTKAYRVFC